MCLVASGAVNIFVYTKDAVHPVHSESALGALANTYIILQIECRHTSCACRVGADSTV